MVRPGSILLCLISLLLPLISPFTPTTPPPPWGAINKHSQILTAVIESIHNATSSSFRGLNASKRGTRTPHKPHSLSDDKGRGLYVNQTTYPGSYGNRGGPSPSYPLGVKPENTAINFGNQEGSRTPPRLNPNRGGKTPKEDLNFTGKVLTGPSGSEPPKRGSNKSNVFHCDGKYFCHGDENKLVCNFHKRIKGACDLTLSPAEMSSQFRSFNVSGFERVRVRARTFASADNRLTEVTFHNVQNLSLEAEALYFNPNASSIQQVNIVISESKLDVLRRDTVTQGLADTHKHQDQHSPPQLGLAKERTRFLSLEFNNCTIGAIEQRAVSGARLVAMAFVNTKIHHMAPRGIDVDISETAKFSGVSLPPLVGSAICLHAKTTVFSANDMPEVERGAIKIESQYQVLFRNNSIGVLHPSALGAIERVRDSYVKALVFENNVVREAKVASLKTHPSIGPNDISVLNNSFNIRCQCNRSYEHDLADILGAPRGIHDDPFKLTVRSSRCIQPSSRYEYVNAETFRGGHCAPFPVLLVTAIGVSLLLLVGSVTVCVVCSLRLQRAKAEANMLGECTSQSFFTLNKSQCNDSLRFPCGKDDGVPLSPVGGFAVVPRSVAYAEVAYPEVRTYQQNTAPAFEEQTESICGNSVRGSVLSGGPFAPFELLAPPPSKGANVTNVNRASCPFN